MDPSTFDDTITLEDTIENTSPPPSFSGIARYHKDTPKPLKGKFLSKILQFEVKKRTSSPIEEMDTDDRTVTFKAEVEPIPMTYSESEEYYAEVDHSGHDDECAIEEPLDSQSPNVSTESVEYAADRSEDDEPEEPTVTEVNEGPTNSRSPSSITNLIKNFVLVDIGPNISDTVNEFTHLLTDVATRKKNGSNQCSIETEWK